MTFKLELSKEDAFAYGMALQDSFSTSDWDSIKAILNNLYSAGAYEASKTVRLIDDVFKGQDDGQV